MFESTTGAYAVKIAVDGKWQVVIVDDFFPALEASKANNENRGVAVGHSYGGRELWVSLLEKVIQPPSRVLCYDTIQWFSSSSSSFGSVRSDQRWSSCFLHIVGWQAQ